MFDDMLDSSTEVNPNLNMANPEYTVKLKKIKKAKLKDDNKIYLNQKLEPSISPY